MKHRSNQLNAKLTENDLDQVQEVNAKLFDGTLNKSEIARFLIKLGLQAVKEAKIEKKTVWTLNGVTVQDLT